MNVNFDIFKKPPDGHPLWVKAVEGLEEAKAEITLLAEISPGEYFIYSAHNGIVVQTTMPSGS